MLLALTREISDSILTCELTHLAREPIDLSRARAQHAAYEKALGCELIRLPGGGFPDSVFIEDTAIVFDDVAIITRPGAESRRGETDAVAEVLSRYRPLKHIAAPGTVDGGDVLVAGNDVFVGQTGRTNAEGLRQLQALLPARRVTGVGVTGCLHLKSAVTAIGPNRLLINAQWVPREAFDGHELVDVDEPYAANALRLPDRLIYPSGFPRTAAKLPPHTLVDADELAKAEGAVTCCSLIVS